MIKLVVMLIAVFAGVCHASSEVVEYGVANSLTPVLNTANFKAVFGGKSGRSLMVDRCGQVRELEYIAHPGTVFTILKKQHTEAVDIYQVETDEYPAPPNVRLYVDGRFIKLLHATPPQRRPLLASRQEIVSLLAASVGRPYVWGGNAPEGVPGLAKYFFKDTGTDASAQRLMLAGLDCSGLLYYATDGWTPRNTSQLIAFGKVVPIAGKQPAEIVSMLQPLDLIVWNGHVVIVLDQLTSIESRLECGKFGNGGVVTTPLAQRVSEIMRTRRPVNDWPGIKKHQNIFVVRRWYLPE